MADSQDTTEKRVEELEREIDRLKGELSGATLAISYLFGVFRILDGYTGSEQLPVIVSKLMAARVGPDRPVAFADGFDDFRVRLTEDISNLLSHYDTD